jgi:Arc/MetJ-type ribon-helix-helix transcriptional regulator
MSAIGMQKVSTPVLGSCGLPGSLVEDWSPLFGPLLPMGQVSGSWQYDHTESMKMERVTVTLPEDLVREIDRREKNRSKFVLEAVRSELDHRRRIELKRSLANRHPELTWEGLEEWMRGLPHVDAEGLVDPGAGQGVRWVQGEGWVGDVE